MLKPILLFALVVWGLIKVTNVIFGTTSTRRRGRQNGQGARPGETFKSEGTGNRSGKGSDKDKYGDAEYVDYKDVD